MEDLVLLFLVAILLVSTIVSTREHMTEEIVPPSRGESYDKIARVLSKLGPAGTIAAFDTQLKKQEDVLMKEDEKE